MTEKLPDDDIDLTGGEVTPQPAKVQALTAAQQEAAAKDAAEREGAAKEDHEKNIGMQDGVKKSD